MLIYVNGVKPGHYIDKHGKMRKKMPPYTYVTIISLGLPSSIVRFTQKLTWHSLYSERKEYGHHKVRVTEAELQAIRPSTRSKRQGVFEKNPSRTKADIWLSPSEVADLNELRKNTGSKPAIPKKNIIENPAKIDRAEIANRRRNMLEYLSRSGQSSRTNKAKLELWLSENYKVEGDPGYIDFELFSIAQHLPGAMQPVEQ